jgi:hypothetical protein
VRPVVPMREALADPDLLGTVLPGPTWAAWRALLIGMMGEALTNEERGVFQKLTGRPAEPMQRVEEFWGVIGRRGGKTRAGATLLVYIGCLCDHTDSLAAGERGLGLLLAQNMRQAGVAFGYAAGIFETVPLLGGMVAGRTADTISLSNRIDLEIRPASFRGLRGPTYIMVLGDEVSFWYTDQDSANADTEILNAVRPGLATTGGPLIVISSPYARRGEVWSTYRRHFGPDGDPQILVAQGVSRDLNPSLPQSVVDRAIERDPAAASAEYLAQFRSDLEEFITREVLDAVTVVGRYELPPHRRVTFHAFIDAAGGSGSDSMTLAIAYADGDKGILAALDEQKPPFSPDVTVERFATRLKSYEITSAEADRWGSAWVAERFQTHGIQITPAEKTKSQLYAECLPLLNSNRVELLDHPRLISQFLGLERKTTRGSGKETIDSAPGAHEDLANAAAGALLKSVRAAPSLWHPEALGEAVPLPRATMVFAVLTADSHGAATVFFARDFIVRDRVVLLEARKMPFSAGLFADIAGRLAELATACRTCVHALFTVEPLAQEAARRGCRVAEEDIGDLLKDPAALALSVAQHIANGRVRVTSNTLAAAPGILDASKTEDPLRVAALCGIALALDVGRSLKKVVA